MALGAVGLRGYDPVDTTAAADLASLVINLVRSDLAEALLGDSTVVGVPERAA